MRIGIDIRPLQNDSRLRGIGTYTRCLIRGLLAVDKENEYVFFVFKNRPLPEFLKEDIFQGVKIKPVISHKKRFVWLKGQVVFPCLIEREGLDIFHSLEHIVAVFSGANKVITVHDFINSDYQVYKKRNSFIRKAYLGLWRKTLRYADRIIAVSEYTKKKVIELTGIRPENIKVTYEAADPVFRPKDDKALFRELRKRYNIHKEFALYAGAIDYHKNIDGLIKAFSRARLNDIDLVLIGAQHDKVYLEFIRNLLAGLGINEKVHLLGHIPQEDLAGFYNMAEAFISVSLCEGFGLPLLEAMSCGRPVIASGNTAMREIVGSCGILVDPDNSEEITYALETLFLGRGLRSDYAARALGRAAEFSWEKTAQDTLSIYKELTG